jgi:transcriptional regulator with XRE-family HTH domain
MKQHRRQRGWTQAQLAAESDMSRSYITALESGEVALPTKPTRAKLHKAFKTNDDELHDLGLLDWTPTGDEYSPLEVNENGVSRTLITEQEKSSMIIVWSDFGGLDRQKTRVKKLPAIGDYLEIMGWGGSYFLVTGVVIPANSSGVLALNQSEVEIYAHKIPKDDAIRVLKNQARG